MFEFFLAFLHFVLFYLTSCQCEPSSLGAHLLLILKKCTFHMFNFATINVYFRFTDIVFLPIWCENNEICLFGV